MCRKKCKTNPMKDAELPVEVTTTTHDTRPLLIKNISASHVVPVAGKCRRSNILVEFFGGRVASPDGFPTGGIDSSGQHIVYFSAVCHVLGDTQIRGVHPLHHFIFTKSDMRVTGGRGVRIGWLDVFFLLALIPVLGLCFVLGDVGLDLCFLPQPCPPAVGAHPFGGNVIDRHGGRGRGWGRLIQ